MWAEGNSSNWGWPEKKVKTEMTYGVLNFQKRL